MVDQSRKNKVQYKENTTARTTTEKKPIDGFGMANDDVSLTVINFFSVAWRLRPGWISQTGRWAAVFSDTSTWTRLLANQRYRSHQFPSNRIKRCSLSLSLSTAKPRAESTAPSITSCDRRSNNNDNKITQDPNIDISFSLAKEETSSYKIMEKAIQLHSEVDVPGLVSSSL